MPAETTVDTFEPCLSGTVSDGHVMALRAGLASVGGRNEQHRNARQLCLVDDKLLQLRISPREPLTSLASVNLYPCTNAFESFEDDHGSTFGAAQILLSFGGFRGVCALSLLDNTTGDQMVVGANRARLFVAQCAHSAARGSAIVAL